MKVTNHQKYPPIISFLYLTSSLEISKAQNGRISLKNWGIHKRNGFMVVMNTWTFIKNCPCVGSHMKAWTTFEVDVKQTTFSTHNAAKLEVNNNNKGRLTTAVTLKTKKHTCCRNISFQSWRFLLCGGNQISVALPASLCPGEEEWHSWSMRGT